MTGAAGGGLDVLAAHLVEERWTVVSSDCPPFLAVRAVQTLEAWHVSVN